MKLIPNGDLVAVYGSLRKDMGNHRIIENAPRQDDGVIRDRFRMVSLGGFPGLLKSANENTDIVVEVYEVTNEAQAQSLDYLEGYPSFYNREVVELADGRECWVYFLEGPQYATAPMVDSGDWKQYRTRGV